MSKNRGFEKLRGVTISKIDATCLNEVTLADKSGECLYIIGVEMVSGIPTLTLSKKKNKDESPAAKNVKLIKVENEHKVFSK